MEGPDAFEEFIPFFATEGIGLSEMAIHTDPG